MVSLSLFAHLLRLFRNQAITLIMLGDINQLPPLKYGRPFEDIINSGLVHIHTLTKNLRVIGEYDDPIIVNSTNIVRAPIYTVQPADNFVIINNRQPDYIRHIIQTNNITLDNIKDHKFITAINDDAIELNRILSSLLNNRSALPMASLAGPRRESRNISCLTNRKDIHGNKITVEMRYSIGDPVIFTKNHVYKHVSNGCEGIISGFADGHIIVEANGCDIRIPLEPMRNRSDVFFIKHMLLAYCITVYKSQGSQWDNVYYYIKGSPNKKFLNKRLTYTAITRASKKCTIMEEEFNLFTLCCRQEIGVHYGGLLNRIKSADMANREIIYPKTFPSKYQQSLPIIQPLVVQDANKTSTPTQQTSIQNINEILAGLKINKSGNIILS
jgi:exodeoxyribonuclease V alpha subunit